MERGRVCEERGRMERKQAACRFIAAFMGACPWIPWIPWIPRTPFG
jgi:hypothetical protein